MNDSDHIRSLRIPLDLSIRLRGVRDARKALSHGLRTTMSLFGVAEGAVATLKPGRERADLIYRLPVGAPWNLRLLTDYLLGARPAIPPGTLLAPVERRGRNWAVLAIRDRAAAFSSDHRQLLFAVTEILSHAVQHVDEQRIQDVRRKLERKIAHRKDAKDLMYDILHGLRSLTHYDHSASLLISRDGREPLELVAEQIAWTKARSTMIGRRFECDEELGRHLKVDRVRIYERESSTWSDRTRGGAEPVSCLPDVMDRMVPSGGDVPLQATMLCAPIATPDGSLGILKVAARRRGVLGDYEARLLESFMPLASLAIQFSMRTDSLRARVLQSERKQTLVNMTRGIAHDVNNALGAMLLHVQQLREDAGRGNLRPDRVGEVMGDLEGSIQTCRRIFGGMLAIARGGAGRSVGHANLRRAVEAVLMVLKDRYQRRGIEVEVDLPKELPPIRGGQGDLTQLLLNLCTNAGDAMSQGGRLTIDAVTTGDRVDLRVGDTGAGIAGELLERIFEPFFTTKSDGSGLGLSICRSVVRDMGGQMRIASEPDRGTEVFLTLPVAGADSGSGQP